MPSAKGAHRVYSNRRRPERQRQALERDAARTARTDEEQLMVIDQRPGVSVREVERIGLRMRGNE